MVSRAITLNISQTAPQPCRQKRRPLAKRLIQTPKARSADGPGVTSSRETWNAADCRQFTLRVVNGLIGSARIAASRQCIKPGDTRRCNGRRHRARLGCDARNTASRRMEYAYHAGGGSRWSRLRHQIFHQAMRKSPSRPVRSEARRPWHTRRPVSLRGFCRYNSE